MNIIGLSRKRLVTKRRHPETQGKAIFLPIPFDIMVFTSIIMVTNTPLLMGRVNYPLMFFPDAVILGELWRLLTHPFVHLSWYHLCLDGPAFLLLYSGLEEKKMGWKLLFAAVCGTSSLLAALCSSPAIYELGLCGLSGIAHGLMAISGLEMIYSRNNGKVGVVLFLLVVTKSIYEALTGTVFLEFLHFGRCGVPLSACHAGGVMGGIICYWLRARGYGIRDTGKGVSYL